MHIYLCKQYIYLHLHTYFWLTFYCRISRPFCEGNRTLKKMQGSNKLVQKISQSLAKRRTKCDPVRSDSSWVSQFERNMFASFRHGGESYVPRLGFQKYLNILWQNNRYFVTSLLSPNMQLKLPQTIEVSSCRLLDYERCIWTRKQWGSVMTSDASKWLLEPVLAPWKPCKTGPTLKKIYKSIWIFGSTFGSKQIDHCSQKIGKSYCWEIPNNHLGCILCTTL